MQLAIFSQINIRDGTKPIPSTRSIGYRVNFKVSVSPKNPIPIPSTFRYYFDTFSILYKHGYFNIKLQRKEVQRLLIMLTAKTQISETITSFHECLLLKLHSKGNNT